ncbi:hypothetical protein Glove_402g39 [Diversispora epigaea]|uniref:Vacuolar protein-sorting-associated protein 25 n=1 Tax=Diversispora epigaea TaxID=1348612 RepID=A0A397H4M4_9GLOM|nr:hypothetical protein Glove_402g39 [Diversispora epigaea]
MSQRFEFPSIHNFSPFYTQQVTQTTLQNQIVLWSEIILSYFRHHKLYRLELSEALNGELFKNQGIKRRLKLETLQIIIDHMVKQGTAEWDSPPSKNAALIYWRKPEEWASLIDKWVFDCGLNNSIVTLYEILHGESSEGMEFHNLNQTILLKALDILVKRGVAQLLQGSSADDLGVKFFGING